MDYTAIITWLEGMIEYYKRPGCGVMYAMHKTVDEKKDARNAKVREQRAANKAKVALRSRRTE
jgi:hypothetical protein